MSFFASPQNQRSLMVTSTAGDGRDYTISAVPEVALWSACGPARKRGDGTPPGHPMWTRVGTFLREGRRISAANVKEIA